MKRPKQLPRSMDKPYSKLDRWTVMEFEARRPRPYILPEWVKLRRSDYHHTSK